jgi:hypothetical protein
LDNGDYDVHVRHGILQIRDDRGGLIVRVQHSENWLYLLQVKIGHPLYLAMRTCNNAWLWHERYDHLHFDTLSKMKQRGMVHDLPHIDHVHQLCADCITTKMKRSLFPSQAKWWAEGLLDIVHGVFYDSIMPVTPSSKNYFLLLVDDKNMFMWVALLAAKSDTLAALKKFQAKVKVETGRHMCMLQTLTTEGTSPPSNSRPTASSTELNGGTPRHTCPSRMTLWSGGTSRWWPWHVAS